jgi:hypothetical protein
MFIFITVLSLTTILTVFFVVLTIKYRSYLNKIYDRAEVEEKEKSLDQLLDKYVVEEQKDIMKEKLSKISKIIADTTMEVDKDVKIKVKVAKKASSKVKSKELEQINKAENQYLSFTTGFQSAWPVTEDERKQDMAELQNVISMLEDLDEESYRVKPKKVDAGVGMFYERMSGRFKKIIAEHKLEPKKFVPIQRLKYHIFQDVKNIKNNDILTIMKIMKDTKLLSDIIEINPQFHLIVFTEELDMKLTLKEKVLLTFAYDEDFLTFQKLLEVTEWKNAYAKRILNGLVKKGIATILDENITVEGFGHVEERKKWNEVIAEQIKTEKEKEEEKRKRQKERARMMRERLAKVEREKAPEAKELVPVEEKTTEELLDSLDDISAVDVEPPKIKFEKKPAIKTLPLPSKAPAPTKAKEVKAEAKQKSKDEDDLLGALEAFGEMEDDLTSTEIPKKKDAETPKLSVDLDDLGGDEPELQDLIPEKILQYHEKFSLLNGGFVQFELIRDYVLEELKDQGEIPEDLLKTMLTQLKELKMIQSSMEFGDHEFFLFEKIMLSPVNKKLIEFAIEKAPLTKEDFMKGLDWPEKRATAAIAYLEKKGIAKVEDDKVIIPGIVQKK